MNRTLSGCLPYAALALVGIVIWPFVAGAIVIKLVLAIGIVGFGMVAMAKFRLGLESRGKYDLKRLERVHEREALKHAEVPVVAKDADEAYCMTCGEAFDGRHPACPRCKTTH